MFTSVRSKLSQFYLSQLFYISDHAATLVINHRYTLQIAPSPLSLMESGLPYLYTLHVVQIVVYRGRLVDEQVQRHHPWDNLYGLGGDGPRC